MVQWLGLCLSIQGVQVLVLIGELRSHVSCAKKPEHKQQKQYCNKFNKDLKKNKPNMINPVIEIFMGVLRIPWKNTSLTLSGMKDQ